MYTLFERYISMLADNHYYDSNILAYNYLSKVNQYYDAIIVDEVQDFTNSQLVLVLKSLKQASNFLLCGDANQIVHPNFFSWSKLKSYFYQDKKLSSHDIVRILTKNYRNTPQVTELANRVLKFKNYRFGSIDKESHYLVKSTSKLIGSVSCIKIDKKILNDMNQKTGQSTHYAILVLQESDKITAKKLFDTPLIFTVQEAKGLEYDNVILYNFVSGEEKYQQISKDVDKHYLQEEFNYARAKNKADKSLEVFKFYINALYVAITRSIKCVYLLEDNPEHRFLKLLDINEIKEIHLTADISSKEDWQKEASRLKEQGKKEQAKAIEDKILQHKQVSWQILDDDQVTYLINKITQQCKSNKKDKIKLLNYAVLYDYDYLIEQLKKARVKAAHNIKKSINFMAAEYFADYAYRNTNGMHQQINQYGLEFRNVFNWTPLMCASYMGNSIHVKELKTLGANTHAVDNRGRNAFIIALEQVIKDKKWLHSKFKLKYQMLQPDSISIQAEQRLIKIDSHKSEYFLFWLVLCLHGQQQAKHGKRSGSLAFKAQFLVESLSLFSDDIVPAYRKRRPYVSSLLARNEINSKYPTNRKLFVRVHFGVYILNPELKWKSQNTWHELIAKKKEEEEKQISEFA